MKKKLTQTFKKCRILSPFVFLFTFSVFTTACSDNEQDIPYDSSIADNRTTAEASNYVTIPDANFRQALKEILPASAFNEDLMNANHSSVRNLQTIQVQGRSIESLEGIEYFTGLVTLWCYQNNLTTLDMSKNTALQSLLCHRNNLTELNINRNTNLRHLICYYNRLEELDLRGMRNPENFNLAIYGNNYYPSSRRRMTRLRVNDRFKDHSAVEKVKRLRGDNIIITVYDNNNRNEIICYNYDSFSGGGDCVEADNWITFSDPVFRDYIKSLIPDAFDEGGRMNTAHGSVLMIRTLQIDESTILSGEINSFEDLKYFENLSNLEVDISVNIDRLDLSQNKALTSLQLNAAPQLTLLDLSKNTNLRSLRLSTEVLPSLDLRENTNLRSLRLYTLELTTLDLSKNTALTSLELYMEVLDSLDLSKNTALTSLTIFTEVLDSLDLSKNTALTSLEARISALSRLDLSQNNNLSQVRLFYPNLDELNITGIKSSNLMPNVPPITINMGSIRTLRIDYSIRENPVIRAIKASHEARIRVYDEGAQVCPDYDPFRRICAQPFAS